MTSITIPESVTSIDSYAFENCSGLTSITIPKSMTRIGSYAFENCSSLNSITIPENVNTMGVEVFKNCDNLKSINIYANELKDRSSNKRTLMGCSNVTSLYISSSVNYIGDSFFSADSRFKEVIIDDCEQSIYLGEVEWYAGCDDNYGSFSKATGSTIEKIYLGRNLSYKTENGVRKYEPFRSSYLKSHVKEIYIGDYVTSLDGLYFFYHENLEILTIGKGLSEVPDLSKYSKLTTLTLTSEVPQSASKFTDSQYLKLKVYVPKGSLEAYQSADVWKDFWNLQEIGTTDIDHTINNGQAVKEVKRYDATGREINSLQKGLNIIKMSDGTTRKVLVK